MTKPARPRTLEQATALAARYAAGTAQIAALEADRRAAIAATEAAADVLIAPIATEMADIHAVMERWWVPNAVALLKGKRKSIDLGGCDIGTRKATARVEFAGGDDKAALAAAIASPHKGVATNLKRVLDKTGIAAALNGRSAAGKALRALGFSMAGGEEVFFMKRVDDAGAKIGAE